QGQGERCGDEALLRRPPLGARRQLRAGARGDSDEAAPGALCPAGARGNGADPQGRRRSDDRSVRARRSSGEIPMRLPQQEPALYPFHIRRMQPEDLAAVMSIQRLAFRNPWSTELVRRELTHEWSTILLAEEPTPDGSMRLLGFSIFWLVQDELHILNV